MNTTTSIDSRLQTEQLLAFLKSTFEFRLTEQLSLIKVSAPPVVLSGTGINDDLNGKDRPVTFPIKAMQEQPAEVVQSLAKWKRLRLRDYQLAAGRGILTDMRAIRPDETLGHFHSLYVDQWDWERVIHREERHLNTLRSTVEKIYSAILSTEQELFMEYPEFTPVLPRSITFLHTEELLQRYPGMSPKEREHEAAREFGAVFLIGIGGLLSNGKSHDDRAPDYDDWSTPAYPGMAGLNGDILVWNPVMNTAMELSSMGIRVDAEILKKQLHLRDQEVRTHLHYHQELIQGKLPQTIGGGIGQSRLCMFLLKKRHVGEVQVGIWPEAMIQECREQGIFLL